jgi:hypothetical protein
MSLPLPRSAFRSVATNSWRGDSMRLRCLCKCFGGPGATPGSSSRSFSRPTTGPVDRSVDREPFGTAICHSALGPHADRSRQERSDPCRCPGMRECISRERGCRAQRCSPFRAAFEPEQQQARALMLLDTACRSGSRECGCRRNGACAPDADDPAPAAARAAVSAASKTDAEPGGVQSAALRRLSHSRLEKAARSWLRLKRRPRRFFLNVREVVASAGAGLISPGVPTRAPNRRF